MPYIQHKAGTEAPETLREREKETLIKFTYHGMMRYRDLDSYYCTACGNVYGVICPQCKVEARKDHSDSISNTVFDVARPIDVDFWQGMYWARTSCLKCDFKFKIIVRS